MSNVKGTKEFCEIIVDYTYNEEEKLRLLKQGKSFEQGLRDMLYQRNLDIKKHEMEEDESEKFQSHLGGISATNSRLKMAMKSMEDDMRREDRRNVINVIIKNKDDELDRDKVDNITDFASEDVASTYYKRTKSTTFEKKKTMSKNQLINQSSSLNINKATKVSFHEKEKEYEFKHTKGSQNSVKRNNNYLDTNSNNKKTNYNNPNISILSKSQKFPKNNNANSNSNIFPPIERNPGKNLFKYFKKIK